MAIDTPSAVPTTLPPGEATVMARTSEPVVTPAVSAKEPDGTPVTAEFAVTSSVDGPISSLGGRLGQTVVFQIAPPDGGNIAASYVTLSGQKEGGDALYVVQAANGGAECLLYVDPITASLQIPSNLGGPSSTRCQKPARRVILTLNNPRSVIGAHSLALASVATDQVVTSPPVTAVAVNGNEPTATLTLSSSGDGDVTVAGGVAGRGAAFMVTAPAGLTITVTHFSVQGESVGAPTYVKLYDAAGAAIAECQVFIPQGSADLDLPEPCQVPGDSVEVALGTATSPGAVP